MAQLLDHIDYLAREIGPRPAGTEEEQQAALYIADQLQRESGFRAEIEEFTSSSNLEGARAIPSVVIVLVVVLAIIFNAFTIPALILSLLAAAVYVLEAFDRPVVSKLLARGASQNVVAKYQPEGGERDEKRAIKRKIVLVAHYDTGKVKPALVQTLENTGLPLGLIVIGGMALSVLLLLVRIPVGGMGGPATIFLNVLTVIALVVVAAPIVKAVLYRLAPYNEGANNNASGTAALIEVARRISSGSISEAELIDRGMEQGVVIHGEQAARESGLVPEGADLVYEEGLVSNDGPVVLAGSEGGTDSAGVAAGEAADHAGAEQDAPDAAGVVDERSEEERLLAAKAAIAALTGRPVENKVYAADLSSAPVETRNDSIPEPNIGRASVDALTVADQQTPAVAASDADKNADLDASALLQAEQPLPAVANKTIAVPAADPGETGGFQNAPDWFIAAQKNAKKPAGDVPQAQRSRYTQAIENAEREAAAREAQRAAEEQARREAEQRARNEAARSAMVAPAAQEDTQFEAIDAAQPEPINVAAQTELSPALPETAAPLPDPSEELAPIADGTQPAAIVPAADPGQTVAHLPIHLQELTEQLDGQDALALEAPEVEPVDQPAETAASSQAEDDDVADEAADGARETAMRGVLAGLPQVEQAAAPEAARATENDNPSRSGMFRKLRADVPSLSGAIRAQSSSDDAAPAVAPQHSRNPLASAQIPVVKATAASADAVDYNMEVPVFDEAAENPASAEAAQEPQSAPTAQGAAADDGAPEGDQSKTPQESMPQSRKKGLRGRLRRGKKDETDKSLQEWLDVDEDFDAREVGRKRGSWESFRDDSSNAEDDRTWQGGGFSRVHLDYVDTRSGEGAESDVPDDLVKSEEDIILNEEIGQIIHFRNPQYSTEVWFVAIGSDTELHDGAKAFVAEHARELRGAMIVEVESLGAGVLAHASSEGQFRRVKASSRIKRYTRDAVEATGVALDSVALTSADSVASTIQKAGYQAMHLMGVEDGRPALKGSADDVVENIDELTLEDNVSFLMELLKHN